MGATFDTLPDEIAGKLIKLLFDYVRDKNPEPGDLLLKVAFEPIKIQLKRDLEAWKGECERDSKYGKLGAEKRWGGHKKNSPPIIPIAKMADNDTDTVNDTVIEKKTAFIPPTLQETINYFVVKGFTKELAARAWESYDVAKWVDSHGNKIKNWKQKMLQVWMREENKGKEAEPTYRKPDRVL